MPPYSLSDLGKAVDATGPRLFIGLRPCRAADTRGNGAPIQGGMFTGGSDVRNWDLDGTCGIPTGVDAVSVNFTVVGPAAAGFLVAWPQGGAVPPVSILNFVAGQTVGNAAIVPVSGGGGITVNVSAATHVIMDVNGYFSDELGSPSSVFELYNNSNARTMNLRNQSITCTGACGLYQATTSPMSNQAIYGFAAGQGAGVGIYGTTNGNGNGAGVYGTNMSSNGAPGVKGEIDDNVSFSGAVVGEHTNTGGNGSGVLGSHAGGGTGVLGYSISGYGVFGAAGSGGVGVGFAGGLSGGGTKSFIEPHPTDPALAIKYVSLEGPEAGTYFRGRGKFLRGVARIVVPEDFRMVTSEEGLSVQITPIGEMASVAVSRIGLEEILVTGSRNVEFFFLVHGVRRAYPDWSPIVGNKELRPRSPDERIPSYYSKDERERLIANGTYTEDGRVNMETAKKLGWDKIWAGEVEKAPPTPGQSN